MTDSANLSVVVAGRGRALRDCVAAVCEQTRGRSVEIVAASAGRALEVPGVVAAAGTPGMLVPELWGLGLRRAGGELVALTIAECRPEPGWLDTALELASATPDTVGLGGPILPSPGGSQRDWAAFLVRYSSYLGLPEGAAREIPGDNAVYRRDALLEAWEEPGAGFWEVLAHARMREQGRRLLFTPRLRVRLTAGASAGFARLRFRHGRHFGCTRRLPSPLLRLPAALGAPLLPPVLARRIASRARAARPEWRARVTAALPWMLVFLTAWSLGEASGYAWRGKR